jgi:hypothetical protein
MVDRIHGNTTNFRPSSIPTFSPGFSQRNIFMNDIAELSNGGFALK